MFDIAIGKSTTVNLLARMLLELAGKRGLKPAHGELRQGDKAERVFGFKPKVVLREGLKMMRKVIEVGAKRT